MFDFRTVCRSALLSAGWDVRRVVSVDDERRRRAHEQTREKWRFLRNYGLNSVVDVGANVGQFARLIREILPQPVIYSFEPLSDCFRELVESSRAWRPAECFPFALGDANGQATIYHNGYAPSSSLLPMDNLHRDEIPETSTAWEEQIEVRRLDDVFAERVIETPYFVKIDVQGFEDRVLRGGKRVISDAVGVVLEISSHDLYRGQPTFDELYAMLRSWGFVFRGTVDQWMSQRDGRILQFDGLFENAKHIP